MKSPLRRPVLGLAAACSVLCAAAPLRAYVLEGASWPSGDIPMQLQLGSPGFTLIDGSTNWDDVAAAALDQWNAILVRSRLAGVKSSSAPRARGNAYNNVFFDSTVYGDSFGSRVLAITLLRSYGATFVEADTVFNSSVSWNSYRGNLRSSTDLQRVALHEFGHTLGLDHPDQANPPQNVAAIMNATISNIYTPQSDDIAGINALYGSTNPPPPPGNLGDQTVAAGSPLTLALSNTNGANTTYAWTFTRPGGTAHPLLDGDGNPWTTSSYAVAAADPSDAGTYTVAAVNGTGQSQPVSARVTVTTTGTAASRLVNLSARGLASTGSNTFIAGFVTNGATPKSLLLRAVGPGLARQGIASPLADPALALHNSSGSVIAADDNWNDANADAIRSTSQRVGAFPLAEGSKDAALLATASPGLYTAHVNIQNSSPGIALLEIYDADSDSTQALSRRLVNLSARDFAGRGEQILIGGFVIAGSSPKRVLLRAVGPGLASQGVGNINTDPNLVLFNSSGTRIADNDDWSYANQTDILPGIFSQVGAFQLASGSYDSALVITLRPGVYTAQVTGRNGETGVVLLEIYEVPD
ncbi:MAG TPA: matrixin family metalloprotease [Opitutus sp.]|nr:matrixin family metalloprotease [Opitutus sp.]